MAKKDDGVPAIAGLTFEQLQECLTLGASLEQITSLAEGGFGYEQIKTLAGTLGAAKAQGVGVSAGDLRELLQAQRKAMKPENEQHPGISAFSYPEGDQARPKPLLRRDTIFMGIRQREESLTPAEIELFNRFTVTKTARGGRWEAKIKLLDGAETLFVTCAEARTLDGRQSLPSLELILRELHDGAAATDPATLSARVAELEAQIKALSQPAGAAA